MVARLLIVCVFCILAPVLTLAGPPFRTDDPEPVEYKHWELYLASQGSFDHDERSLTAPHVEINYGVFPNVQLHLLAPLEYVKTEGQAFQYGYGDTELGVKFRFIQETDWCPQVGIFPIFLLPQAMKREAWGAERLRPSSPSGFRKVGAMENLPGWRVLD